MEGHGRRSLISQRASLRKALVVPITISQHCSLWFAKVLVVDLVVLLPSSRYDDDNNEEEEDDDYYYDGCYCYCSY